MKISKKILTAILVSASLVSLTACDEETPASTGSSNAGVTSATSATTTTNTLDDDANNPVDITDFVDESKTLENPNLTYLGHYDMRVAGDIKPGVKLFEETYGGKIDYVQCAWEERYDKLQIMIASGESPDLFDKQDDTFPYRITRNVYEDLTDYMDLSQAHWDGMEPLVEQYSYQGKHYYYPFTANAIPNCLIYNKSLFESLSIADPMDLYRNNEWTWANFKQCMIDFMKYQEDPWGGVYGLVGDQLIITTGTPLIGKDADGNFVSNMNSAEVERAANFLEELRKEELCVRGDGMWSNESAPLAKGKVAFLGVGQWKITDFCKARDKFETGFVPFPRDEKADKYYYGTSSFGYMVPKGASNIKGAATFIDIMRQCQVDPELRAVVKESIMNDKKYNDEQYDFLTSFEDISNYDMVVELYGGFSTELTNEVDTMMVNVAFEQGEEQKSWTQLRSEIEGMVTSILNEYKN